MSQPEHHGLWEQTACKVLGLNPGARGCRPQRSGARRLDAQRSPPNEHTSRCVRDYTPTCVRQEGKTLLRNINCFIMFNSFLLGEGGAERPGVSIRPTQPTGSRPAAQSRSPKPGSDPRREDYDHPSAGRVRLGRPRLSVQGPHPLQGLDTPSL